MFLSNTRFLMTFACIVLVFSFSSCDDEDPVVEPEKVPAISTDGLVAYFPFNGNSQDVISNFNGTDTDVEYPSVSDSVVLDIDGSDSYVKLGDDFDFVDRTISLKFYSKMSGDGLRVIYGSDHSSLKYGSTIITVEQGSGELKLNLNFSDNIYYQRIEPSKWYHVTMRLDDKYIHIL